MDYQSTLKEKTIEKIKKENELNLLNQEIELLTKLSNLNKLKKDSFNKNLVNYVFSRSEITEMSLEAVQEIFNNYIADMVLINKNDKIFTLKNVSYSQALQDEFKIAHNAHFSHVLANSSKHLYVIQKKETHLQFFNFPLNRIVKIIVKSKV